MSKWIHCRDVVHMTDSASPAVINLHHPWESVHVLERQAAEPPLDFIAVVSFELTPIRQGLGGLRQIDLKPAAGMSGGEETVKINQFQFGSNS